MKAKVTVALLAAVAVGTTPISAQAEHDRHHPTNEAQVAPNQQTDVSMMMMRMMMSTPRSLLQAADRLGLDETQRTRLAALEDAMVEEHGRLMEAMKALMADATMGAKSVLTPRQLDLLEGEMDRVGAMGSMMSESSDAAGIGMHGMPGMAGIAGMAGMKGMAGLEGMVDMMAMCHAMRGEAAASKGPPEQSRK